jgi:hypothetical protein
MRIVLVLCATFALTVGVATATADQGGNSADAHACQQGGWVNLQGSDGTQFANQDQCVSFGAQGGTIVPKPSVSLTFTPDGTDCAVAGSASHFAPQTRFTAFVSAANGALSIYNFNTDPSGTGFFSTFVAGQGEITVQINDPTGAAVYSGQGVC